MYREQTAAIQRLAVQYGIEPAMLMAVIKVESSGLALVQVGSEMLPEIRWEGHYFDRYVPARLRQKARDQLLAHPSAGRIKNPREQSDRYKMLHRAMKLDQEAALKSISMGVGQVMGSHADTLGYPSVADMFAAAKTGYEAQVDMMVRYIIRFDLKDELERKDFTGFARGYNGPGYAKGAYHTKIQDAYERFTGLADNSVKSAAHSMLRMGSRGRQVRELQSLLVRAGYALKTDGDFGVATKHAVKAFQEHHDLEVDGVVGPSTMQALSDFRQEGEVLDKPDLKNTLNGVLVAIGGPAGVEVAKKTLEDAAQQVMGFGLPTVISQGLSAIAGLLVLVGLGLSLYQFIKAQRRA
jgi:hypothetical protein